MTFFLNVHHIRYAVKNIEKFVQLLQIQLQFQPFATRSNLSLPSALPNFSETIVLKHQDVVFIIDKRVDLKDSDVDKVNNSFLWGNNTYPIDTVCDVCLHCSNIEQIIQKTESYNKDFVKTGLSEIQDNHGIVKFAVIQPPIGNVQHTLIDLSNYKGPFLPGFHLVKNDCKTLDLNADKIAIPNLIQLIDHVAFAVNIGQTDCIMKWYNHCMGFNRLIINVDEDENEGFVVQEGMQGLRLKAMFGPLVHLAKCKEPFYNEDTDVPKFVFCEALNNNCKADQVSHFMHMHHGPGVQHIAFSTKDIVKTVACFKRHGLNCILPPESYYSEVSKGQEIQKLKYNVETLKSNNILLESHFSLSENLYPLASLPTNSIDVEAQIKKMTHTQWFIMQVFTSPVFEEKTLFFEIIQRFQTISGFGAGNIGALWRAVQKELFA